MQTWISSVDGEDSIGGEVASKFPHLGLFVSLLHKKSWCCLSLSFPKFAQTTIKCNLEVVPNVGNSKTHNGINSKGPRINL